MVLWERHSCGEGGHFKQAGVQCPALGTLEGRLSGRVRIWLLLSPLRDPSRNQGEAP